MVKDYTVVSYTEHKQPGGAQSDTHLFSPELPRCEEPVLWAVQALEQWCSSAVVVNHVSMDL